MIWVLIMVVFRYTAMNAKGENTNGVVDLPDKNALTHWLKEKELFLVSCHDLTPTETDTTPPEATQPMPVSAQAPIPEHWGQEKSKWPVLGPLQRMIMIIVFLACVYIGYLIGR